MASTPTSLVHQARKDLGLCCISKQMPSGHYTCSCLEYTKAFATLGNLDALHILNVAGIARDKLLNTLSITDAFTDSGKRALRSPLNQELLRGMWATSTVHAGNSRKFELEIFRNNEDEKWPPEMRSGEGLAPFSADRPASPRTVSAMQMGGEFIGSTHR